MLSAGKQKKESVVSASIALFLRNQKNRGTDTQQLNISNMLVDECRVWFAVFERSGKKLHNTGEDASQSVIIPVSTFTDKTRLPLIMITGIERY